MLCRCIKQVRSSVRLRKTMPSTHPHTVADKKGAKRAQKEKAAIGICITSVLHSRGKTVKQFHCRPSPYLRTQRLTKKN